MAPNVIVYDAQEVAINLLGVELSLGLADGEFLKITPRGPAFADSISVDGEVTRSKTGETRYDWELTLTQTSSINTVLSGFATIDEKFPNGAAIGPFMAVSNDSFFFAEKAWISQPPDMTFAKEPGTRVWKGVAVKSSRNDGQG